MGKIFILVMGLSAIFPFGLHRSLIRLINSSSIIFKSNATMIMSLYLIWFIVECVIIVLVTNMSGGIQSTNVFMTNEILNPIWLKDMVIVILLLNIIRLI